MIIDIDTLTECWVILKQYIPPKDRQEAADNLISFLVDQLDDEELRALAGADSALKQAVKSYEIDDSDSDDLDGDQY